MFVKMKSGKSLCNLMNIGITYKLDKASDEVTFGT